MAAIILAGAVAIPAQTAFLLSDFENGANLNTLEGYWYFFGDASSEGNSRITTSDPTTGFWDKSSLGEGYGGSKYSGRFGWMFGDKRPICGTECTYDPEVNMVSEFFSGGATFRDLSGATHLRFHSKANTPVKVSFLVRQASIKDNAFYRQEIEVGKEWKEFTIALQASDAFMQPTWGARVPFDLSKAVALQLQVSLGSNPVLASDTLLIDDVMIVGWTPPNSGAIRPSLPGRDEAGNGLVTLGFSQRLSISLAGAPADRGGEVLVQDLRGRVLARSAYSKGQPAAEVSLRTSQNGLAMVRIVPSP